MVNQNRDRVRMRLSAPSLFVLNGGSIKRGVNRRVGY